MQYEEKEKWCTSLWLQFVCAALVLVDNIAWRQPVDGGIKDWDHHSTGETLFLAQTVKVTVAHLDIGHAQDKYNKDKLVFFFFTDRFEHWQDK